MRMTTRTLAAMVAAGGLLVSPAFAQTTVASDGLYAGGFQQNTPAPIEIRGNPVSGGPNEVLGGYSLVGTNYTGMNPLVDPITLDGADGIDFPDKHGVSHTVSFDATHIYFSPALAPDDIFLLSPGQHVLTNVVGINTLLSGYLKQSDASGLYLTASQASSLHLPLTQASTYLKSTDAASTYLSQTDAATNYVSMEGLTKTLTGYLSTSDAAANYVSTTQIANYPTRTDTQSLISSALSSYIDRTDATNTFAPITGRSLKDGTIDPYLYKSQLFTATGTFAPATTSGEVGTVLTYATLPTKAVESQEVYCSDCYSVLRSADSTDTGIYVHINHNGNWVDFLGNVVNHP